MALLKACNTIPELYQFLTEEYKPEAERFVLHRKVEGKYKGITYNELK